MRRGSARSTRRACRDTSDWAKKYGCGARGAAQEDRRHARGLRLRQQPTQPAASGLGPAARAGQGAGLHVSRLQGRPRRRRRRAPRQGAHRGPGAEDHRGAGEADAVGAGREDAEGVRQSRLTARGVVHEADAPVHAIGGTQTSVHERETESACQPQLVVVDDHREVPAPTAFVRRRGRQGRRTRRRRSASRGGPVEAARLPRPTACRTCMGFRRR